jgi:hypothetical protein
MVGTVDEIADQLGATVDQLGYAVDLDQARTILDAPLEVLEKLWQKVDALAKHRKIDPELRAAILRVAGHVDPALVPQLSAELDEFVPAVVLAAHAEELIEDRPLSGFPAPGRVTAPSIEAWLIEDPRRLRGLVLEACRFSKDDRLVVTGVIQLAESLGIDLRLAGDIVTAALIDARRPQGVAQ